ncbi:MAG: DUF3658 domain-containing protein [Pedobacter sp.]
MDVTRNVHVIFGLYLKSSLERSFSVAAHLAGEVFSLGDDHRIGPIATLDTPEGFLARKEWFKNIDDDCLNRNFEAEGVNDYATIEAIKQLLLKGQVIHIWFGDNSFDLLALGRLFTAIQHFAKQLILVPVSESIQKSLNNREFVPKALAVLRIEQIPLLEQHFRATTDLDLERFLKIWSAATLRTESLRMVNAKGEFQENVLEKINDVLISFCTDEYQKSARVIGETFVQLDFEVSDATLNWMLKTLITTGQLQAQGTLGAMRDYKVKLIPLAIKNAK